MSPLPYVFPALPSPQVKIIHEYLKCYSAFDFEGFSKVTTDDFTQQTLPLSLDQPIRPKAEEIAALKQLRDALGGEPMRLTIYDIDDGLGKTWVHLKLDSLGLEGIYLFEFGKGLHAHKVASVREFVDSDTFLKLNPKASEPST